MKILIFLFIILAIVIAVLLVRKYTGVEFVAHAKLLWKAWSVWLSTAGAALGVFLLQAPDALRGAWDALPPDLRGVLPVNFVQYITYMLVALGIISQFIRQKKLVQQKNQMEVNRGINH